MKKINWETVLIVAIALLVILLMVTIAFGQTVGPQWATTPTPTKTCTPAPTKTPTFTATPTPSSPTPTYTQTPGPPTPTPTITPTPHYIYTPPTPYPTATPTATATATACGHACIPGFIQVGAYFALPDLPGCTTPPLCSSEWQVTAILPSGYVELKESAAPWRVLWVNHDKIAVWIPVTVATLQ